MDTRQEQHDFEVIVTPEMRLAGFRAFNERDFPMDAGEDSDMFDEIYKAMEVERIKGTEHSQDD